MVAKKRFVIEPHSLYYLHPSKCPGVMITAIILDEKDYDLYKRVVRAVVKAKNKLSFINGSFPRPMGKKDEEFSESHACDMANSMLCSWLLNIIDLKIRMTIAYSDTMKIMSDNLKRRYGTANTPKIHQRRTDIANKQGSLEVGEFYSKLVHLWTELSNLMKVLCTCSGCKCGAGKQILEMYEEDRAH